MHVHAGDGADAEGRVDGQRGGLVQARRVAQRSLDDLVHERDGDIGQQQARDRLVDAAILPERADAADPERRPTSAAASAISGSTMNAGKPVSGGATARRRKAAEHDGSLAADDDQPEPRRQRHAERGEQERRRPLQRSSAARSALPNPPMYMSS